MAQLVEHRSGVNGCLHGNLADVFSQHNAEAYGLA